MNSTFGLGGLFGSIAGFGLLATAHAIWQYLGGTLLIGTAFTHMNIGMQVVIEDYIHVPATKIALLILSLFVCWSGAALGIFSILKVAFGGAH